jgi:hypothetical protein
MDDLIVDEGMGEQGEEGEVGEEGEEWFEGVGGGKRCQGSQWWWG